MSWMLSRWLTLMLHLQQDLTWASPRCWCSVPTLTTPPAFCCVSSGARYRHSTTRSAQQTTCMGFGEYSFKDLAFGIANLEVACHWHAIHGKSQIWYWLGLDNAKSNYIKRNEPINLNIRNQKYKKPGSLFTEMGHTKQKDSSCLYTHMIVCHS